MLEQRYRWKNKHLREHVSVLDGRIAPTMLLKNARYLNQAIKKWVHANIWILGDRIVYVGEKLPDKLEGCEIVDCNGMTLVPGYIEPHAHPFQLYNPLSFARYAAQFGTTTLINDNMVLALQLEKKKAFSFLKEMRNIPSTMYWWCRFDAQTEIQNEETTFSHGNIKSWLEHDAVLQGGELTGWPKLLDGDDLMLHWMQEAKRMRKQIEGHFPGASEKTLAKLMLLGADCDHEAINGQEIMNRLMQGYTVSLRYSSIRPDLPQLLDEMHELGIDHYESFIFTTDGSSSSFSDQGIIDQMIRIALEKGVPTIDAYNMGTINVAKYYNIQHLHGNIATGRVANINFLENESNPTPVSVLAKGKWIRRDGENTPFEDNMAWEEFGFEPLEMNWELTSHDMQFSMPFGIKMESAVITKPYSLAIDISGDELSKEHDECFFMLIDRKGKWRVNTVIKGFAKELDGLASSYSNTGDIILIGKSKKDMMNAFNHMKEIGGGIVISEQGNIVTEIPLKLKGIMSNKRVEDLIEEERTLLAYLRERGYRFADPIYTLLFFSSTHLPYIRVTQRGMYDVMNKTVLFPTMMR
ncbi:adenine deaminase C-terminal domain-containing protein [Cytobacillus kochii]|uniref:adenine deaminase C-terminal domain-containing protein n=1 Tax=Cytobacillus kochii TaxID=859143 RepID=UPI002040412D|nr:adenine deaminase C-terminal domain-containing protein [Cytobacillus kochii]MCM3324451.1 amidohydrolase family protein [Cytobacillus kochii]MCM3346844.1 amidohydrolase family protein [Cytobacillus kochii]MDM5206001.1 adenine deaminase C-terminal domain-containing protein [Cytobacillus kochii]